MSLLKPKIASKSKTISIRVPLILANELDEIKRHADELGLALDIADVVERALAQAVRIARNELTEHSPSH